MARVALKYLVWKRFKPGMCTRKGTDLFGRATKATAQTGVSHALALSSQTGVPAARWHYHSSSCFLPLLCWEFPPPQLCWQKELSEHSLVCFQQVRWISQQRAFKPTCSLCLKQMKVLLNKPFYQLSYGSSNCSIRGEACGYKLATPSSGTVTSATHSLSRALLVSTSYNILHTQHLSTGIFYSSANTKLMQLHWKFFHHGLS